MYFLLYFMKYGKTAPSPNHIAADCVVTRHTRRPHRFTAQI